MLLSLAKLVDLSRDSRPARIAVTWLNQEQRIEPVTKAEVEAALGNHGGDRRSVQAIALNFNNLV